jgi:hypothetical protein
MTFETALARFFCSMNRVMNGKSESNGINRLERDLSKIVNSKFLPLRIPAAIIKQGPEPLGQKIQALSSKTPPTNQPQQKREITLDSLCYCRDRF